MHRLTWKQWHPRFIVILAVVALLISPTIIAAKEYQLTILHTNDHHGHFMKFSPYGNPDIGGLAAQSTLVNSVRAEVEKAGGYVLVLSAGDVNTGVPESDLLDAEPDIKAMNLIGYAAMTLGNHEFDRSRKVLLQQQEWADFPFLSANIVKKETGETLVDAYMIKEFDGLKAAIFGLTTEETPILTMPANSADLEFKSAIATAQELVPKLKAEADIVIALTHLGFYEEAGGGYNTPGDWKLAQEVPEIDLIVGGHTHTKVTEPKVIGSTPIVQAGAYSEYVGRLDLTIDSEANKITNYTYKLLSVNGKKRVKYGEKSYYLFAEQGYPEDQELLDMMKPFLAGADELLGEPVGEALVELVGGRAEVRSQETNLGNLVTDAMRAKTGADMAFQNGGGIRSGIAPGTITYRSILTVQPFGNTLVLLDMTGAQVLGVLNYAASIEPGNGAWLHASGVKATLNKTTKTAENVMVGEAPLDLNATYKVVTNNFMGAGGDGYAMFKDLPKVDTNFVDADAILEYIEKLGKVEPKVEGRFTIVE